MGASRARKTWPRPWSSIHPCCPVKTSGDIPKGIIPQAMELLKDVRLQAPVHTGDTVVSDILGTGVSWIATKDM
ncbi:DUF1667 domain-containing protein [Pseudoflavonifractor phocaeensis]|uniref:DUF1667 domain-containing protein n=1 Tax=Pseudoflavonifractor phocaeensis TaxID=1870988 RepID=UPI00195BFE58|nr:DUF1667 domain-containing protein [Pseudoflavonifractor phocaeensis]